MAKGAKVTATVDDWDAGKLGRDAEFVARTDAGHELALDEALSLQMISVRLQKQLIDDLKFIATAHGIGYQPLMRDILMRFVAQEKKQILRDALERRQLEDRQRLAGRRTAAERKPARTRKAA